MSVSVTGTDEILKNLEIKLGKRKTSRLVNAVLLAAGDEMVKITKNEVVSYKKTGATHDEVVRSNIKKGHGGNNSRKEIDVGWRGDKSRWRLVHLNEFGYTKYGKYIHPRGTGAVQRAVDKAPKTVLSNIQKRLKEGFEE
ncbi:hypothetical protein ACG6P0_002664 [Enterococcus hirae]|uniref:hypothetical protein n=1 Tax=Enterococcus hirae TaxID=1354 RepID=UPI001A10A6C4|nr:hypothetical protein [Enterococcus hirae]EMF0045322.1 hypothetical protein [Enterococcus hirae]EMF0058019.1 hypothetical protein [Enterococcus hirae]EMF0113362.1 hypothetical protein [Enterococcus hirae]EMF0120788.1 hypothetical protein [Enterococcus hirae]EMF0134139.1 hypothetical protein [Enterococcus hirae]